MNSSSKNARQVLEEALPDTNERRAVLEQVVRSAQAASTISPSAWAVTLREDGFRLNVGQVETLTLFGDTLRVLLAASEDDPRLKGQPVANTAYRSGPVTQCAFVGSVKQYTAAQAILEPMHLAFVDVAARTGSGKPRRGTPFVRYHSAALMDYATLVTARGSAPAIEQVVPYPFKVGQSYTRRDVFQVIGVEDHVGGPWFTGYAPHGADWFIFCGIGARGRTGHDYANFFDGDRLVWFAKGSAKLEHPSTQDLLNPAGRVYIFYREHDRDPFVFAGLGTPAEIADTLPVRVVWTLQQTDGRQPPTSLPEEVDEAEAVYRDGASKTVTVNIYERDPNARRKCIKHWGVTCYVCTFDFEASYGELGAGFIHVHHLRPLGEVREEYALDPVVDLRPVCPNCHAMLHRERPALGIDQLKSMIRLKN